MAECRNTLRALGSQQWPFSLNKEIVINIPTLPLFSVTNQFARNPALKPWSKTTVTHRA